MAPSSRKNHNYIVKVLVPQKVSSTISDMESYYNWMSSTTTMKKKTGKGKQLELSDLPDDLMESVLERLSSADRIRFGATCKKNLSFFVTTLHHHQYQFRVIDKLPWMASFLPGLVDEGMIFRLYEPQQQRGQPHYADYLIRDPEGGEGLRWLPGTEIKACKKGWFLCLFPNEEKRMTSFLLFCPFNKRILQLPNLDCKNSYLRNLSSCQATFSSDDPSSPDCVFFFLYQDITPGKFRISTLDQRSGNWNSKLFDILTDHVKSVVYHEGCFYCLSFLCELAAFDVIHQTWNLITAPFFPLRSGMLPDEFGLVVCEGKLILAFVHFASLEFNNLEVFRCGLLELNSSTSTWVEKANLGDHALFLGDPTSFTVTVPSGSNVANKVYFYSYMMSKYSPIYYSFKNGRCNLYENGDYWSGVGDYWSGVECEMWIEPLPTP